MLPDKADRFHPAGVSAARRGNLYTCPASAPVLFQCPNRTTCPPSPYFLIKPYRDETTKEGAARKRATSSRRQLPAIGCPRPGNLTGSAPGISSAPISYPLHAARQKGKARRSTRPARCHGIGTHWPGETPVIMTATAANASQLHRLSLAARFHPAGNYQKTKKKKAVFYEIFHDFQRNFAFFAHLFTFY